MVPVRVGRRSQLRRGDIVELRSPADILATLDDNGCLEGVPFMPEMLEYLGRRYTVTARVERACDTINPVGVRRMPDTVLLDDLRCDGSAHGGCDAGCRLYWKEAWLRRVPPDGPPVDDARNGSLLELEERVRANTNARRDENGSEKEIYRCQATEFPRATQPLKWYDTKLIHPRVDMRQHRGLALAPGHDTGGSLCDWHQARPSPDRTRSSRRPSRRE